MNNEEETMKRVMHLANKDILFDRITKIQSVMREYGEENFYISFSGGKDSTVLHHLVDMALPDNKIPRVYANTGIEYNEIVKFVKSLAEKDDRFQIIEPSVPIKQMLEKEGYPFKSKHHCHILDIYQRKGLEGSVSSRCYIGLEVPKSGKIRYSTHLCPKSLKYQFTPDFKIRISDKCCDRLKKDPMKKWGKDNKKAYSIIGIMAAEGGNVKQHNVLHLKGKN